MTDQRQAGKSAVVDLEYALLAILMYLPDKLARQYADEQMNLLRRGEPADKKILDRIAKLVKARSLTAQSVDVYRALPVIEAAAK